MENKGRVRSFAEIFGEDIDPEPKVQAGPAEIAIEKLVPYEGHPFKLYEGQRLDAMVSSIKEFGVILPIVVRPKGTDLFEILSGHNRVNAAKIADIIKVPAVIKEGLTEEDAALIVTETNLMQRSFGDLSHSERAIALKRHYEAIKSQGKKNDLICEIESLMKSSNDKGCEELEQLAPKSIRPQEKVGADYSLSRFTVARYLQLNEMIPNLLKRVDEEEIAFIPAVDISYISKEMQLIVENNITENMFKIDMVKAELLKNYSKAGNLSGDKIFAILSGELTKKKKSNKPVPFKLKPKLISKYFKSEQKQTDIEEIIEKALEMYFSNQSQITLSQTEERDVG